MDTIQFTYLHRNKTLLLFPGKSHGRRSLVGWSPWGCKESDTTERLHFHFPRSCIGEGNGNPLQCSCLENPRDRGAWWAAVYGVTQSRIWLKRLSSSSSSSLKKKCFAYFVDKVSWDIPCSWLLYWHHRKAALLRVIYCGKRQRSGKRCSHRHPWHLGWHHAPAEELHIPLLGILWPVSVVPRNRV